jgi:class 3 adenylate cyclase
MVDMTDSPQQTKLAILFADISGSTALYDKLGDAQALKLVAKCLDILIAELLSREGVLIKTIGDEIMCSFPTAALAFDAACAMQRSIETQRPGGEQPIYIRIGFHFGEVIKVGEDLFGDAVNVAARVTSITRARQILATQAVFDSLPAKSRNRVRHVSRAEFRGKEETMDVFQVNWELDSTLTTRIGLPKFRKPTEARYELLLRYRQQIVSVNEQNKSIVLGRGENCNLIIQSNFASRQHASLDFNFGKFVITDHSANGTYLRFSDNQVILISQQEVVLHGTGTISLGQPFSESPVDVIEYLVQ